MFSWLITNQHWLHLTNCKYSSGFVQMCTEMLTVWPVCVVQTTTWMSCWERCLMMPAASDVSFTSDLPGPALWLTDPPCTCTLVFSLKSPSECRNTGENMCSICLPPLKKPHWEWELIWCNCADALYHWLSLKASACPNQPCLISVIYSYWLYSPTLK